eukprot:355872-Chlamydomonas_euryale.AAC.3
MCTPYHACMRVLPACAAHLHVLLTCMRAVSRRSASATRAAASASASARLLAADIASAWRRSALSAACAASARASPSRSRASAPATASSLRSHDAATPSARRSRRDTRSSSEPCKPPLLGTTADGAPSARQPPPLPPPCRPSFDSSATTCRRSP